MRLKHEREPRLVSVPVGDLRLAVWEWGGHEPALLFAHATSFHGRCWDSIIREFPDQRCVAIEARGHGRSSKPAPPYHWTAFREDLLAILSHLGISGAIGTGHSLGGHALVAVAATLPGAFSRLVLVDPTIRAPEIYNTPPYDVSFVRKRRARWSSPDEMFARFCGRPPFNRWKPEVLRDYCQFGLLPEDGAYVLACPPEIEASIYECSKEPEANLQDRIPSLAVPVTVLRAGSRGESQFSRSPTDPELASRFPLGTDVLVEDCTHYIPMEAPEVVVEHVRGQAGDLPH